MKSFFLPASWAKWIPGAMKESGGHRESAGSKRLRKVSPRWPIRKTDSIEAKDRLEMTLNGK